MAESAANVAFPFVGQDLGGSHISALGLIRKLDRSRYAPIVFLEVLEGPIFELFRAHGIDAVAAPIGRTHEPGAPVGPGAAAAFAASALALARRLRKDGIAIVHVNDGRSSAAWALPAKLAGAKLVWHNRGNPQARGLRFVAPFLADRVVSVSRFASPKASFLSAAGKNDVVHSPFDTHIAEDRAAARAALAAEIGLSPSTAAVGFFGSLIERKRPLKFVETIAALMRSSDVSVYGLFFGAASDAAARAVASRAQELGVGDRIRLMGYRAPGSRWIAACDVLLVPAVEEPFGRTLIEAMLVGTPVVATRSGGNTEAIEDGKTGLLAAPDDPEALAAAVARLVASPQLAREIAANASREARLNFGEDRHALRIMEIYDAVRGRQRRDSVVIPAIRRNEAA